MSTAPDALWSTNKGELGGLCLCVCIGSVESSTSRLLEVKAWAHCAAMLACLTMDYLAFIVYWFPFILFYFIFFLNYDFFF